MIFNAEVPQNFFKLHENDNEYGKFIFIFLI